MKQLQQIFLVLMLVVWLGGCSAADDRLGAAFVEDEIYAGYPCGDSCEAFKTGYETAMKAGWKSENKCIGENLQEIVGCKAYVADYRYDNKTFEELLQDL